MRIKLLAIGFFMIIAPILTHACFNDFSSAVGAAIVEYHDNLETCAGDWHCNYEARAIFTMRFRDAEETFDQCMAQQ